MKKIFSLFVFITGLLFVGPIWGREAYVKALFVDLKEKANFNSGNVSRLKKGSKVEIKESEGEWLLVRVEGKEGYVTQMLITDTPPTQKVSLLSGGSDLSTSARKRASNFTSAAAARGLREGSDKFTNSRFPPNYKSLKIVESLNRSISGEKSVNFLNL